MTEIITNAWLNIPTDDQKGGLMLSFGDQGTHAPKTDIQWVKPSVFEPRPEAQPKLISRFRGLNEGPKIAIDGITIKHSNSFDIGLPKFFGFALAPAQAMAEDLLGLYGEDRFHQSAIKMILQRSDVFSGNAQRNIHGFDSFHTHVDDGDIDYVYSLCGALPTEYQHQDCSISQQPEGSLMRFGAETHHRSKKNDTRQTLRRLWGAFTIHPEGATPKRGTNQPHNPGWTRPGSDLYDDFMRAGADYLETHSNLAPEMDAEPA
jgi:hypothetical protein